MDRTLNFFISFDITSMLGVYLYWVPLLLCGLFYTMRTLRNYFSCCEKRNEGEPFDPDTIGILVWRVIVTFTPVLNLLAVLFDLGWVALLSIPLVRPSRIAMAQREARLESARVAHAADRKQR